MFANENIFHIFHQPPLGCIAMPVLDIAKSCQHEVADLCRAAMPKLSRKANVLPGVDGYLWEHKRKKTHLCFGTLVEENARAEGT